jgi:hypothetical protein
MHPRKRLAVLERPGDVLRWRHPRLQPFPSICDGPHLGPQGPTSRGSLVSTPAISPRARPLTEENAKAERVAAAQAGFSLTPLLSFLLSLNGPRAGV